MTRSYTVSRMGIFDEPSLPEKLGSYRIERLLATGGMGEVLLAWDEGLDRPVAIKRLRTDGRATPERRERFRREALIAAKLNHPSIVRVYDLLEQNGAQCIVMEYIEGTTLRRALQKGPMPVRLALSLAISLTDALAVAHHKGIIHRDLKTENVMFTSDCRVKITDFGIAKFLLADEASLTKSAVLLGTCRAMAPEQALGNQVDRRSDLFSLGVLMYETLTGVSPFDDKNDLLTLRRLTTQAHRPARSVRPEVPKRLSELIDRLLAKSPDDRPSETADVVIELVELAQDLDLGSGSSSLKSLGDRLRAALGR